MDLVPWIEPEPADAKAVVPLVAALATTEPEFLPEELSRELAWTPPTTGAAEWAMAHLARAQRSLRELEEQADEYHARILEWVEREEAAHRRTYAFFEAALQRYGIARREVTGVATINLPSGRVATRRQSSRVVVSDPDAVVAWCKSSGHDHAVITTERPDLGAIKALTHIEELPVAWEAILDDDLRLVYHVESLEDVPVAVGEVVGTGQVVAEIVPVCEQRAVGPDGTPVPGTSIEPERVGATVSA